MVPSVHEMWTGMKLTWDTLHDDPAASVVLISSDYVAFRVSQHMLRKQR